MNLHEFNLLEYARTLYEESARLEEKINSYPSGNIIEMNQNGYKKFYVKECVN